MAKKPNPRLRRVRTKPKRPADEGTTLTAVERQDLAAVNWILHHPQYPNILSAIRMGTSNADIADHFIERGYFQVTRKTAMIYLAAFRRKCPDLCKPREGMFGKMTGVDGGLVDLKDYDHLFDGNMLSMSLDVEIMKLIQVQKQRIAIDYASERSIGKLFATTAKEVQVLGELFERFHKIKNGGRSEQPLGGGILHADEDSIRDGLAAIRQDEADRRITSDVIRQVVKGVVQG